MPRCVNQLVLDPRLGFVQVVEVVDKPLPGLFFLFWVEVFVGFILAINQAETGKCDLDLSVLGGNKFPHWSLTASKEGSVGWL